MKNNTCAIALFKFDFQSIIGLLIAIGTQSMFVHAAVRINGEWWHSSESVGEFDRVDMDQYGSKRCLIWEVPSLSGSDISEWLEGKKGIKYDWVGIAGWVVHFFTRGRFYFDKLDEFYCFDTAVDLMAFLGYQRPEKPYSGKSVRSMFDGTVHEGRFEDLCGDDN